MDQYMPGPNLPLTGDETIKTLRAKNCRSVIVGMSANDVSDKHLSAGADAFYRKPFTKDTVLQSNLVELLKHPPLRNALIVDDEGVNRHILQRTLKQLCPKCAITEAESSEAALEQMKSTSFDVVILDEHMGGPLTGSDVAKQLREEGYSGTLISLSGGKTSHANAFDLLWSKPMPPKEQMASDLFHLFPRRQA
mmetsp:Transcript_11524/g.21370  ORF Transcript_11524/g.21370 Transcript_11524/m.21370 type:complete len:194 (+) Transcript_11524:1-582(+)